MRRSIAVVGFVVAAGCVDPAPTETLAGSNALSPSLSIGSEGAPPIVFNAQMRADHEIPTSTSESKGHSHFNVRADGVIESLLKINNKDEVVRFCHIHVINTAAGTGPIVWWLSPTFVQLQLTDKQIEFRQDGDYVNNAVFGTDTPANDATARAALLADPSRFYVNCHSNRFPPGFMRGNLP
jgi:CHRD domain-containing protein